jgi:hypothetical protein
MNTEQTSDKQLSPPSERELVDLAVSQIDDLLPAGWSLSQDPPPLMADGAIRISAPDGLSASLSIEAKALLNPKDALFSLDQMASFDQSPDQCLMVARYLSPRVRELLENSGASYADSTGNIFVGIRRPGLAIRAQGKNRDPFRGPERRTSSLKGGPAARVVRALADRPPPWTMRELAKEAGTSLASTSRAVDFLDREALLIRNKSGSIIDADWKGALRRWADDYQLVEKRGRVRQLIAPRGLGRVIDDLRQLTDGYALSGSLAAHLWAPYADAKLGLIYSKDAEELESRLDVRPSEQGVNLIMIEPLDDLPFLRSVEREGLVSAAPSQVAVDLMVGSGRNPAEGEELLAWMSGNENAWRTP